MKRRLPELAILLGAASVLLSAVLFAVIQSEGRGRRDQACTQSEREHKVLVGQLKRTYRLLGSRQGRRQLGPGLVQLVVRQLPETERRARVDIAPAFCDEEGIGLPEPDPKLPAPRDFSHLLEGTARERQQLRQRARGAQRAMRQGGGGGSPDTSPRSQQPPSRQPRRDGGGNQGQPSPSPQTPSEQPQQGPQGPPGPQGPSGPAVPSAPPPAPAPPVEQPRGPVQGLLEDVGGLVDQLLPLRP